VTRPDTIRIGPLTVTIVSDKKTDRHLDDLDRRGDSDLTRCTIRLHSELSDDAWAETLCHEVLHFCWALTSLPEIKEPTEEQTILALSPWLRTLGFLDSTLG
jgi:hypothetical protein